MSLRRSGRQSGLAASSALCVLSRLGLLGLLALLILPSAAAQPVGPVDTVPFTRWGSLEPRDVLTDATWYLFDFEPDCGDPSGFGPLYWVRSVDVEAGRLFAATGNHVLAWNLTTAPATPSTLFAACRPSRVACCDDALDWYFNHLEAVEDGSHVAVAGPGIGLVVLDSSGAPVYQDYGYPAADLTIVEDASGIEYAAVRRSGGSGLVLYDLDKARTANCHDSTFTPAYGTCRAATTAYVTILGQIQSSQEMAATDSYLGLARFNGFEVWDLSDVSLPLQIASAPSSLVRGLELWTAGGQLHVAIAAADEIGIYRFSPGCSSECTPTLVSTLSTPGGALGPGVATSLDSLQHSEDGGRLYLYAGSGGEAGSGPQREWLFDVTDPVNPFELTPPPTTAQPLHDEESGIGGYWGWYYRDNGGWNNVDPTSGVVSAYHLFRAATGVLDVHAILQPFPPVASFARDPSGFVYVGDAVSFTDTSTGPPTAWSWSFGDGDGGSSTLQNPTHLYDGAPGAVAVTLEACNDAGCDSVAEIFDVLDPAPQLDSVTASPSSASPCEWVQFAALAVTGSPPLAYDWEILDDGSILATSSGSQGLLYQIPETVTGAIAAHLTLTNGAGSVAVTSPPVTVVPLAPLSLAQPPAYETPVVNGLVQFHLTGDSGATRWEWWWGDGTSDLYTDADTGRNPTHQYPPGGSYSATVTVSNCTGADEVTSPPADITVPSCEVVLENDIEVGTQVLETVCTLSVGPDYTVLSTAQLDFEASRIVIQPSFSVARGASVVLRTGSP